MRGDTGLAVRAAAIEGGVMEQRWAMARARNLREFKAALARRRAHRVQHHLRRSRRQYLLPPRQCRPAPKSQRRLDQAPGWQRSRHRVERPAPPGRVAAGAESQKRLAPELQFHRRFSPPPATTIRSPSSIRPTWRRSRTPRDRSVPAPSSPVPHASPSTNGRIPAWIPRSASPPPACRNSSRNIAP